MTNSLIIPLTLASIQLFAKDGYNAVRSLSLKDVCVRKRENTFFYESFFCQEEQQQTASTRERPVRVF